LSTVRPAQSSRRCTKYAKIAVDSWQNTGGSQKRSRTTSIKLPRATYPWVSHAVSVVKIRPVHDGKERVLAPARRRPARDQAPRSGPTPLDVLARDEGRRRPRMRRPLLALTAHRMGAAWQQVQEPQEEQKRRQQAALGHLSGSVGRGRPSLSFAVAVVVFLKEDCAPPPVGPTPTRRRQRSGSRTQSGSVSIVCRLW
jgi:hypothetical protein